MAKNEQQAAVGMVFFLNDRSRITYNELCRKCQHECKQSLRAVVVDCPKYSFQAFQEKDKTAGNGKIPLELRAHFIHSPKTMYRAILRAYLRR